jgi:hypothetical protein
MRVAPGAIISLRSEREFKLSSEARNESSTPIGVGILIGTQNKTRVKNAQAFGNIFNTPGESQPKHC